MGLIYSSSTIDLNKKKPGINSFGFILTTEGLISNGGPEDTTQRFSSACLATHGGLGCTAWVLTNDNMDYLRCDDLSWNDKTKCD